MPETVGGPSDAGRLPYTTTNKIDKNAAGEALCRRGELRDGRLARDLPARIERLEAIDEIRQLAAKYAVALDMRDLDALVNLFVEDVGVPGKRSGRAALRAWYDAEMRRDLLGSAHGVLGTSSTCTTPTMPADWSIRATI